jgi:hypothetical protein
MWLEKCSFLILLQDVSLLKDAALFGKCDISFGRRDILLVDGDDVAFLGQFHDFFKDIKFFGRCGFLLEDATFSFRK